MAQLCAGLPDQPGCTRFFYGKYEMWRDLWVALALLMIIEGIWPFLSPQSMRRLMISIAQQNDRALRLTGLASMVGGVIFLYIVH